MLILKISLQQELDPGRRGIFREDEGSSASQDSRGECHSHEWQCHIGGLSEEVRGHCFQGDVLSGA